MWADEYFRDLKDVLTLRDEVARQIASGVRLTLTPEEQTRLTEGSVDPEAYKLYLHAHVLFNQQSDSLRKQSIELFQQVNQMDPNYARATRCTPYASLGRFYEEPNIVMPKAREAALRALKLDDKAQGLLALATVRLQYDWDWDGAESN